MTAAELLARIENEGGEIAVLSDGGLRCQWVPLDLVQQLQAMKAEIISLLREREQPRTHPFRPLIPWSELHAARERLEARQAAERQRQFADM